MSNSNEVSKHCLQLADLRAHNIPSVFQDFLDRIINLRPNSSLLRFEIDELHVVCHP
jgi:hypothetical protein